MAVEAAQFALADAAGEGRDMVDVGLGDHGRHGRGDVAGIELVAHMLVPQRGEVEVRFDLPLQGGDAAFVSHQVGRFVEVHAADAGEGVIDAGVEVQLGLGQVAQAGQDRVAGLLRAVGVLFGEMQHQPALDLFRLVEQRLDAHAVVAHRAGDVGARRGEVGQLAAHAEADEADPGVDHLLALAQVLDTGGDVVHRGVQVDALEQLDGLGEGRFVVAQVDPGCSRQNRSGTRAT